MNNKYILGIICALIACWLWASSFIGLKIALATMNPMSVIFGRMLIASLFFAFFYKNFLKLNITKNDWKYILFLVFCEPGLYFLFEVKALEYTSASQAGVITSTMPLMTAIGAAIFLKENLTKRLMIGMFLAMLGSIWLSLSANVQDYAPNPILGNALEACAMVCAAGYTISLKHLSRKFSALVLTAFQAFGGAIFFLPFAFIEYQTLGFAIDFKSGFSVLYLAVGVTMCGYGLFNYALTLAPASKISVFINFIPVFTLVLAYFILHERLNSLQFMATALIFFGVLISQNFSFENLIQRKKNDRF